MKSDLKLFTVSESAGKRRSVHRQSKLHERDTYSRKTHSAGRPSERHRNKTHIERRADTHNARADATQIISLGSNYYTLETTSETKEPPPPPTITLIYFVILVCVTLLAGLRNWGCFFQRISYRHFAYWILWFKLYVEGNATKYFLYQENNNGK
jgi:hypothetical protein